MNPPNVVERDGALICLADSRSILPVGSPMGVVVLNWHEDNYLCPRCQVPCNRWRYKTLLTAGVDAGVHVFQEHVQCAVCGYDCLSNGGKRYGFGMP